MRNQKIDLFLNDVGDCSKRTRLLDVGGGRGVAGELLRLHSSFAEVVIVNLDQHSARNNVGTRFVKADACALPFATNSFDWVFSNAVIEHVGHPLRQRRFADEIRRVAARGYFVATPNKHFPIEPHTLLPFYQFLPPSIQRRLVWLSPGYMREPYPINLLSGKDMQILFPEARVHKIGVPFLPSSLVATYKNNSHADDEIEIAQKTIACR